MIQRKIYRDSREPETELPDRVIIRAAVTVVKFYAANLNLCVVLCTL